MFIVKIKKWYKPFSKWRYIGSDMCDLVDDMQSAGYVTDEQLYRIQDYYFLYRIKIIYVGDKDR